MSSNFLKFKFVLDYPRILENHGKLENGICQDLEKQWKISLSSEIGPFIKNNTVM